MADILVVIDHPAIGIDLWDMLQNDGHEVRHVTCCQAALAALSRRLPDLIVADFAMPGPEGGTFVDTLKCDTRYAGIPLIQVSHSAVAASTDTAIASYIRKPSSQLALLNTVSRLTASAEADLR